MNDHLVCKALVHIRDTASVFHDYWPQHALPDVVGMAYAPESKPDTASFLKQMQKFHDDFSGPKRPFILAQASPMTKKITEQDRIDFLNTVTSTNAIESLPHYIGLTYFIYPPSRAHKRLIIYPALHADKRIIILDKESAPDTDKSKMNSLVRMQETLSTILPHWLTPRVPDTIADQGLDTRVILDTSTLMHEISLEMSA